MRTEILPHMTLKGLSEKVTCPILFLHNEEDILFDVNGLKNSMMKFTAKIRA